MTEAAKQLRHANEQLAICWSIPRSGTGAAASLSSTFLTLLALTYNGIDKRAATHHDRYAFAQIGGQVFRCFPGQCLKMPNVEAKSGNLIFPASRITCNPSPSANPPCVGAHHLSRKLKAFGHDARLMPAKYVRPYSKGQKNDFRDAEAIAEAVQRPTMKFVTTKTADQLDLQALHRVRERLVSQRTGIINQIRAFLLERGVAVRRGQRFLRTELPRILATPPDVLSPRMVRLIEGLTEDWRRLDQRIENLSSEIEELANSDPACVRLMSIPGIGPIISSAMVAAIGTGDGFSKGRDFAAWLGLVPKQISTGDRTILGRISKRGNRYLRVLFVQAAWV